MSRTKGSTTPKSAASARRNGKLGGRKAGVLPPAMMKRLGAAPIGNPIQLARWYTSALGLLSQLRLEGHAWIDNLAQEIRANATAAGKIIPHDIVFSASRIVRDDEEELAADGGPDEVEVDVAPTRQRAVRAEA